MSYKIIHQIYKDFILCNKNKFSSIKLKNYKIQKCQNIIYYIKIVTNIKNLIIFCHYPFKKIKLPNKLGYIKKSKEGIINIPAPDKKDLINIRFQFQGNIKIYKNKKSCKIKKIWKKFKIPNIYRNDIPLLFYNETFISAIGLFVVLNKKTINKKNFWKISWKNYI
ncbi:tRNA lysidine(34) synthetase TilS [Buchnera aphidicola]|uniref:tRNA lysidine(34) synthetase TilS n=1 Tax=Buchnera aphidicola TaxID=9 RepID=UPI0031B87B10